MCGARWSPAARDIQWYTAVRILPLGVRVSDLRQPRLERHDPRGFSRRGRAVVARQCQDPRDMRGVRSPDRDRGGAGLEVIGPVGKTEAALGNRQNHLAAVLRILPRTDEEHHVGSAGLQVRCLLAERGQAVDGGDSRELGRNG